MSNLTLTYVNAAIEESAPLAATVNMTPYTIADAAAEAALEAAAYADQCSVHLDRLAEAEAEAILWEEIDALDRDFAMLPRVYALIEAEEAAS